MSIFQFSAFLIALFCFVHCEFPANMENSLHQVSIRITAKDEAKYGNGHICSGVLITHIGILTAASCLLKNEETDEFYNATELKVAMGSVDLFENNPLTTQYIQVTTVKIHGRFNKNTLANNLALLKVDEIIFGTMLVAPKIPTRVKISGDENCYVLGWKFTEEVESTRYLMQSNVVAKSRDVCQRRQETPLATFCSSETSTTEDLNLCVGEIGAGLICNDDLRGVVSRTCDDQIGTQYTDVSQHFNWIFLSHSDESLKIIDNEYLRKFVFSVLDFFAYYIGTDKIADDLEFVKFLF